MKKLWQFGLAEDQIMYVTILDVQMTTVENMYFVNWVSLHATEMQSMPTIV